MKKYILLICLVAAILVIGCTTQAPVPEQETPEVLEPIKIGYLGPLTGDVSSIGQNNKDAIELALKEINDAGGINGRPLEVIYEDSKCNAKDAVTAAQKLVNIDQVPVILGGLCSSETLAAAPIAEGKTVMFSSGSSSPDVTNAGDYIFRDYPSDLFQAAFAAEFVYNDMGLRNVAILSCLSDWCVGLHDRFKERFEEVGGNIVREEQFEQGSKDLRTQLTKIKDLEPDLIYFPSYTESAVVGFQQMKELGITVPVLGGDAWTDPTIYQRAGNAAEGGLHAEADTPISDEFRAKMKAFTGSDEVILATPQTYDAINIYAQVMRDVGTNPEDIKNALYKVKYDGVSGHVEFDENGDLKTASFVIMEYKDGGQSPYQPLEE